MYVSSKKRNIKIVLVGHSREGCEAAADIVKEDIDRDEWVG